MPLINSKDILSAARTGRYGVLSLLGGDLAMTVGLVAAAEEKQAPLILVYNEEVTPMVPIEIAVPTLVNAAERAAVPVAVILDHGRDIDHAAHAIELGCSSVMFDGSALPFEENVAQTAAVVELAHGAGVDVEAELGSIAGSAIDLQDAGPKAAFTDPEAAAEFVERTGADVLAISFGNVHGVYRGEPHLDLGRVRNVHAAVPIPLAMHGASGLKDGDYPEIVESGISKICYYTAMGIGASDAISGFLAEAGPGNAVYHEIMASAAVYFRTETGRLMDLVGSTGAARPKGAAR